MEFTNGFRTDERNVVSVQNSWRYAKNILLDKGFNEVSNEYGFSKECQEEENEILLGICKLNTSYIKFSKVNTFSKITLIDNNICKTILKTETLNFNINYPIEAVFTLLSNGNIVIAFTDNNDTPKILNINCLPFELNNQFELINKNLSNLINLFPNFINPNYQLDKVLDNGGKLPSGVISFTGQYILKDNSVTNTFHISNNISIVDDVKSVNFNDYDGCEADTKTSKSIKFTFLELDTNFSKINVIVIQTINGITRAYYIGEYSYIGTSLTITYTGFETHLEIPLESVLIPTITYNKVKTLTPFDKKLVLGNLEIDDKIDYQKYANNIKVNWCQQNEISVNNIKTSYKDEVVIFDKKGFRSDEVIALYIDFSLKNGGFSDAFLISGREPKVYDLENIQTVQEQLINPLNKRFQIYSTAKQDGTMGYWENENEQYPDDDCYDVFNQFGKINTLRNKNIRHHRFPSLSQLTQWNNTFATPSTQGVTNIINFQNFSFQRIGVDYINTFNSTDVDETYLTLIEEPININNIGIYKIKAKEDISFSLNINLSCNLLYANSSYNSKPFLKITKKDIYNNSTIVFYQEETLVGNQTLTINQNVIITLLQNEIITFERCEFFMQQPTNTGSITANLILDNNIINNITVKPLGIKVFDIYIPNEIKEKVNGYRILYAKRTPNNSLIVGQSLLFDKQWEVNNDILSEARFHSFDMLLDKYDVSPTIIKPELILSSVDDKYVTYSDILANYKPIINQSNYIRNITNFKYVPNNLPFPNSLNINNESREEFIYFKVPSTISITDYPLLPNKRLLCNIVNYKIDCYKNFNEQELISTGKIFKINDIQTIYDTGCLYGGDTFINAYGIRLMCQNGFGNATVDLDSIFYFICESVNNINFRHEGIQYSQLYYPKSNDLTPLPIPSGTNKYGYTNYFGYNKDYSVLNKYSKTFAFYCNQNNCDNNITKFKQRIHKSLNQSSEEFSLNWRTYLANDYYDMNNNKGEIWKLTSYGKVLLIHQEHSLFTASIKDKLNTNSISDIYVGTGDIFDRAPDEVLTTDEGYAGCQSQWAAFISKVGYIFPDRLQGKWFLFNGQLTELSAIGNKNWFFNNTQTTEIDIDNPFINKGLTAGYDEEYNRLIIVKNDGENSYTLSYNFNRNIWVCFHDYIPNYLFNNRKGLYSIGNQTNVFKHNNKDKFCIYYDNVIKDSIIDIPFVLSNAVHLKGFYINTEVINKLGGLEYNKTITHFMVYNNKQCSGIIPIVDIKPILDTFNARHKNYSWFINKFKDVIINQNLPILDNNFKVNNLNLNTQKSWFNKNEFMSNLFIIRLIYDNKEQNEFYLQDINLNNRNINL